MDSIAASPAASALEFVPSPEFSAELKRRLGPPVPRRDLVFVDALSAVCSVFAYAVVARLALGLDYPFAWSFVWPAARQAIPISVAALLLSATAMGLYGDGAERAPLRQQVAAVAYAAAAVIVVAVQSGGGRPSWYLLLGALAALVIVPLGRRLYWSVASAID